MVFTARYLDLFTNYISLYNTCMKVDLQSAPPVAGFQARSQRRGSKEAGAWSSGLREEGWGLDIWV